MGKGDKKTRRGKITIGTFGVRRPRKRNKPVVVVAVKKKAKPKATAKPKAATKPKTTAKAKPKATAKTKTTAKAKKE